MHRRDGTNEIMDSNQTFDQYDYGNIFPVLEGRGLKAQIVWAGERATRAARPRTPKQTKLPPAVGSS